MGGILSARAGRIGTIVVWALCLATLLYVYREAVSAFQLRDPDDAMRMAEVRDWMHGQSWFDVTQYRSNPPAGAPMHWSRLVDVPIAGIIALSALFVPVATAEWLAAVMTPAAMLLGLFLTVHAITVHMVRRPEAGILASTILATSIGALIQFVPMRIDHHDWQILLGAVAVLLTLKGGARLDAAGRARHAVGAGFVMALALVIAVEGLPLAVVIGGLHALRYLRDGRDWRGLAAYLAALCGGCTLLVAATLGLRGAMVPWCDTMSPAYILPLFLVAVVTSLGAYGLRGKPLLARLALLAAAGGAGGASYLLYAPQCLAGPFAHLDPLVRDMWYKSVSEGLPIWRQENDIRAIILPPALLGLMGSTLAIRYGAIERRRLWTELLFVQIAATAVSIFVMRAMGLSHVLAVPGTAWLVIAAFTQAQRLRTPVGRVLAGASCFFLTSIGVELIAVVGLSQFTATYANKTAETKAEERHELCQSVASLRPLAGVPATVLFAPVDIGPHILAYTPHSVIATGHHRNIAGMATAIRGFTSSPDRARAIVMATPARLVALCSLANEIRKYRLRFPHSLAANLVAGRVPDWLERVPLKGPIRLYRIRRPEDQAAVKRSATPFMQ